MLSILSVGEFFCRLSKRYLTKLASGHRSFEGVDMNVKQRVSLFVAAVFPVLALSAYFLLSPLRASAQSCPGGQFYAGQSCTNSNCNDGHGGCEVPLGDQGSFVFCPNHPGPGICQAGHIVCCTE
jgi:hypothetical protein